MLPTVFEFQPELQYLLFASRTSMLFETIAQLLLHNCC